MAANNTSINDIWKCTVPKCPRNQEQEVTKSEPKSEQGKPQCARTHEEFKTEKPVLPAHNNPPNVEFKSPNTSGAPAATPSERINFNAGDQDRVKTERLKSTTRHADLANAWSFLRYIDVVLHAHATRKCLSWASSQVQHYVSLIITRMQLHSKPVLLLTDKCAQNACLCPSGNGHGHLVAFRCRLQTQQPQ